MAIEQTVSVSDRTMLVKQMDDRLSAVPSVELHFARVEPTGEQNAFGDIFRLHPQPWRYTVRITDPALLVERQQYAIRLVVQAAMEADRETREAQAPTDAEIDAVLSTVFAAGFTLDGIRTLTAEDLETKRRAGTALAGPVEVEVADGRQRMKDAGIPF